MIIKGLFRRYERWNPVHPTYGAFWGMGIGVGCGVGWGPGFGPDVIGYVGAGCGVGFSVGFTIAGIGIGLPANYLFEVPYNAFTVTRSGALEIARSSGFLSSDLQKEVTLKLSRFKPKLLFEEGFNSLNAESLRGFGSSTWSSFREFPKQFFKNDKGHRD